MIRVDPYSYLTIFHLLRFPARRHAQQGRTVSPDQIRMSCADSECKITVLILHSDRSAGIWQDHRDWLTLLHHPLSLTLARGATKLRRVHSPPRNGNFPQTSH